MKRILIVSLLLAGCVINDPEQGKSRCTADNKVERRRDGRWQIIDDCNLYETKQTCRVVNPRNPYRRTAMCW